MHDLEIRGAGDLLGEGQHGEIAAVGLELYNTLLRQAVTALQGKPLVESPAQVSVSLPVKAFLPVTYVTDERLRLRCYQELAACATGADLERAARGLVDRFGPCPRRRTRSCTRSASGCSPPPPRSPPSSPGDGGVRVQLALDHGVDLASVVNQWRGRATVTPTRVVLSTAPTRHGTDWPEVLLGVLRELGRLQRVRARVVA